MWKAELRLMELRFRSSGKKPKDTDSENTDKHSRENTLRNQYQAVIPELRLAPTPKEKDDKERYFEKQQINHFPRLRTRPTIIQQIQPRQKHMDYSGPIPKIELESGYFYRTLDVLVGEEQQCDPGQCVVSNSIKTIISPEEIEDSTGDIKKSELERFGYFTAMVEEKIKNEDKLVPYFVHEKILELKPICIKSQSEAKHKEILYILVKQTVHTVSVYVIYKNDEESSSSGASSSYSSGKNIKKWLVYKKNKTETIVDMHPRMQNYFNQRPYISIPGVNTSSTAGDTADNCIVFDD